MAWVSCEHQLHFFGHGFWCRDIRPKQDIQDISKRKQEQKREQHEQTSAFGQRLGDQRLCRCVKARPNDHETNGDDAKQLKTRWPAPARI